ncbi:Galactokinase [archaeon HR06]|nr:Galactokinase [archaeon HR06]
MSEAWAPCKVILVGEHFVVHGSYSLVLAIDKGCLCKARISDEIVIKSENLNLEVKEKEFIPKVFKPLFEVCKSTLDYLKEKRGVKLVIKTQVNPSSGLGSSASCSVAIVLALAKLFNHELKEEEVFNLAMIGESLAHGGNPSGIDISIAIKGGALLFKKGEKPLKINFKDDFPLIVVYSGIERETGKMIEKVLELKKRIPFTFKALTDASSKMSLLASEALERGDYKLLSSLMNFYQIILDWLGVSTPTLNKLVEEALKVGGSAAKLTGGGGGGSIIILPLEGEEDKIIKHFKELGYEAFKVRPSFSGAFAWKV